MIEITSVTSSVVSPAPATPAQPAVPAVPVEGNPVPQPVPGQQGTVSESAVRHAVDKANTALAGSNEKVGFGYDKRLGILYVQVLDKTTGKVVREIPSRAFLEHQAYMRELAGMILDKKA